MSDTPETQEAIERWRQGKINIFDEMARMERERDEARNCFKVAMETAETYKRERDEAIRALTNIAALPTMAVDHNVVRARKMAQEALRNVEGAK